MKKRKLLMSLGSVAALTVPMASILMTTSCGTQKYAELVSEMKDDCVQTFMNICRTTHRNLWNEGEAYEYVQQQMQSMGFTTPAGYDKWSQLKAFQLAKEVSTIESEHTEWSGKDYGNIWYDIDPTPGYENQPKIILQCHMDSQMDFYDDWTKQQKAYKAWAETPSKGGCIDPNFNNSDEIMTTKSGLTSLGADGGVGMAILLTIAKYRNEFAHPGLRLLFTAGESEAIPEQKADGIEYPAYASGFSLLYYDQLRDEEHKKDHEAFQFWEGKKPFGDETTGYFKYIVSVSGVIKNSIFVSSSGIHECSIHTPNHISPLYFNELNDKIASEKSGDPTHDNYNGNVIDWKEEGSLEWKSPAPKKHVRIAFHGFQGGTSSTYIDKGQGSAAVALFKTIFTGDTNIQLIQTHTEPDNAYSIPTDAWAEFATFYEAETWKQKIEAILPSMKVAWPNEDWDYIVKHITIEDDLELTEGLRGMSKAQTRAFLIMMARELRFGAINWFEESGEVKTSSNFGPCNLDINQDDGSFQLNFHVVERSSEAIQLQKFKTETHAILNDGFYSWFKPNGATEEWQEDLVAHVEDPAWEKPQTSTENRLANAFTQAYNSFKVKNRQANEHAWLEIACAPQIYKDLSLVTPNCVMIGPQVEKNHSINEVLYTDTLATVIETLIYVLDNVGSLLPK